MRLKRRASPTLRPGNLSVRVDDQTTNQKSFDKKDFWKNHHGKDHHRKSNPVYEEWKKEMKTILNDEQERKMKL